MSPSKYNSALSKLFAKGAHFSVDELARRAKGLECDPCDPLLPLKHDEAFFGTEKQDFEMLIREIFRFLREPTLHHLFLLGPQGSGKTIFAYICSKYIRQQGFTAKYRDVKLLFEDTPTDQIRKESPFEEIEEKVDLAFYDNAFVIHRILPDLLSMEGTKQPRRTKICLLMNYAELEAYRRHCMLRSGNRSYKHFITMPSLTTSDIKSLIQSRLKVCHSAEAFSAEFQDLKEIIPPLAHGNPGLALRLLEEAIKFSSTRDDLRISLSVDLERLTEFSGAKIPLIREILVREAQNEIMTSTEGTYLQNRELVDLLQKSKGTISHHLNQLVQQNLLYEQPMKDGREKAYRPNNTLFGLLEQFAFQTPHETENLLLSFEGISNEER